MTEQTDLEKYLAKCRVDGTDPKPSVVKILAGEDVKPVEPGFDPSNTRPSAEPSKSTQEFLADQAAGDFHRLQEHAAKEILAAPAFNRQDHDEKRARDTKSLQLGGEGQSYITGMRRS
jgi:hypothetical protein